MTIEMEAGWLGMLAALWNADGLEAWTAKLVGVLVAVFALTALFSLGFGRKSGARSAPVHQTARPRPVARTVPPKNRKKKPERIIRRYRPVSHTGPMRPLARRTALKLVDKPAQLRQVPAPGPASPSPAPAKARRGLIQSRFAGGSS